MIPSHNNIRRRRCSLQVPMFHNYSSNISNNSSGGGGEFLKKSVNSPTKSGNTVGSLIKKKMMYSQNLDPECIANPDVREHLRLRRSSLQAPNMTNITEMEFLNRGNLGKFGRFGLKLKFQQQDSLRSIESSYSLQEDNPKSTDSESNTNRIWIWENRERRHIMKKSAVGFSFDNP